VISATQNVHRYEALSAGAETVESQLRVTLVQCLIIKQRAICAADLLIMDFNAQKRLPLCVQDALIEHLNAELALGTIRDVSQAVAWIQTTFLFVRVRSEVHAAPMHMSRNLTYGTAGVNACACKRAR
jgi:hypothetical protein